MAIKYSDSDIKLATDLETVLNEEEYDEIIRLFEAAYGIASSKDEAESLFLNALHEAPYYDKILSSDADVKKRIVKALQSGTVEATPSTIQATEALLGKKTDNEMFNRLDEEALVKMFGAKDLKSMLNWDYDKHWTKIPYKDFIKMSEEAGLDPEAVVKSLAELQELHDREAIAEGYDPATGKVNIPAWLGSGFMGIMAPRTKEAIKMGRDPSMKDYVLDIGSNVVEAVPFTRGIGLMTKATKPAVRRALVSFGGASAAPLAEGVADAALYNDDENPYRSRFNLGNVALGTAINYGTPLALSGFAGRFGRYQGERGIGRRVQNALQGDPYIDFLDRQQGIGSTTFGGQKLRDEVDESIMYNIIKDMDKADLKKLKKEQLEAYMQFLATHPEIADKRRDIITNLRISIEGKDPELAKRLSEIFETENPSTLTPTTILGENADKYGLDKSGNLAYVEKPSSQRAGLNKQFGRKSSVEKAEELSAEHNIPTAATEKSARDIWLDAYNAKKEAGGDYGYPSRPTEFDKAVQKKLDDPAFMEKVNARDPLKNLGFTSGLNLATNKAGRAQYGYSIIAPEQVEALNEYSSGMKKRIKDILADATITRQWDAGFIPKKDDDIMWEAYNIYMAAKKDNKKPSGGQGTPDVILPQVAITGKKAGF